MDQNTLIALIAAGFIAAVAYVLMGDGGGRQAARVKKISGKKTATDGLLDRFKVESQGSKRKQIEESLTKLEERQKQKKKKSKSLEMRIVQANWTISAQIFTIVSAGLAFLVGTMALAMGVKPVIAIGAGLGVGFGIPRFVLNFAIARRQKAFMENFADAMDIIVRGVRTGLPLGDCLKIIAHESPDPLGAEFRRVVEAEGLGIPVDVCLEQLYERIPVSEVNFFATVLNIQKTTGGNLGESLENLSKVLRGRKMLREKIKALSAEAKASAIIIACLPIVVMVLVSIASPDYMNELYTTSTGQRNLMIGAGMMVVGTLVMKKMINFKV